MLELNQKALGSRLTFCVKLSGWKLELLTTALWWSVFSVPLIIHLFEWATEVNVQLQVSSFISLDGIW